MNNNTYNHCEIDGFCRYSFEEISTAIASKNKIVQLKEGFHLKSLLPVYPDDLPTNPDFNNALIIVLDDEISSIIKSQNTKDEERSKIHKELFRDRNRMKRLAIRYQIPYIETSNLSLDQLIQIIIRIIDNPTDATIKYVIPNPDNFNEESFNKLQFVVEGESKVIRQVNSKYTLISYKPTIHSHKQQRAGVISGSDKERKKMTKDILYILDIENIPHCYVYVGNEYTLCEKLDLEKDIPPIEVIVKRCCVGTDKHRYFEIENKKTRFGGRIVGQDENKEYPDLVVRYDYRNPNHHPDTKKPMGDEALCDDLANYFIDVEKSKALAKKTFTILAHHFHKMGVYFVDVCFMFTTDGSRHFYEISQDCGRYKKLDESGMNDLDKDVWRSGGSSELVLQKWNEMTKLTHKYVRSIY